MASGKLTSVIKYLLFLAIGILLMYFAFKGISFSEMLDVLKDTNYTWVILSLVVAWFAFMSRAYRWIILIEPLGHKPKLKSTYNSLMVGYFANLAFPRIGEITRCATLYELEKTPVDSSFGTVVAERVIDLICLLTLLLVTFIWKSAEIGAFFSEKIMQPIIDKFASLPMVFLIIAGAVILILLSLLVVFRKRILQMKFALKIKSLLTGVWEGLRTVFRLKRKGEFLLHSVLIWTFYFIMTYICFFAIEPTSGLGPMTGLFILVAGGFGMSAPVQGGIGAYHIIVSGALTLTAITGAVISPKEGLAFAFLMHTSQTLLVALLGSISLISIIIAKRKLLKNEQA